jgi:hypothetical protein
MYHVRQSMKLSVYQGCRAPDGRMTDELNWIQDDALWVMAPDCRELAKA